MATLKIMQGLLILADMCDSSSAVDGPTLDGMPLMDNVQLPRSNQAYVIDRGSRVRTLKFSYKDSPAPNAPQALFSGLLQEWSLEASSGSPITVNYGGSTGITLTFTDGAIAHTVAHQGVMAIHTYTITAGQLTVANFDVMNGLTVANSLALARIITTTAGAVWLELRDTTTNVWEICWLKNGIFTVGGPAQVGPYVRVNAGELQLWDVGINYFCPIWLNNGALTVGPQDGTVADGNPATAARLTILSGILQLQLLDNAHQPQFSTLFLSNGILKTGLLMA